MAAVVVDTDTQLLTVVDVPRANARYSTWASNPAKQSEDSPEAPVAKAIGDPAGDDSGVGQESAETGRKLVAPVQAIPSECISRRNTAPLTWWRAVGCSSGQATRQRVRMATPLRPHRPHQ